MRFEGEIHGSQMNLTMRHQVFGADNGLGLPLRCRKGLSKLLLELSYALYG